MKLSYIPLQKGGKRPAFPGTWKALVTADSSIIQGWLNQGLNLGLPLEENGLSVVDFDGSKSKGISGKVLAREFYKAHKDVCKVISESRRGFHMIFSGATKTRKLRIDDEDVADIKGNGYLTVPPSVVFDEESGETWTYRFVPGFDDFSKSVPFPEHLFPTERKEHHSGIVRDIVRNVPAYLARIEAIKHQGRGWAAGLVRAASVCRDAGLTEAQAMVELIAWNDGPTVFPKYPLNELARACSNVYRNGA